MPKRKQEECFYVNDEVYYDQIQTGELFDTYKEAISYINDMFDEDKEDMSPLVLTKILWSKDMVRLLDSMSDIKSRYKAYLGTYIAEPSKLIKHKEI